MVTDMLWHLLVACISAYGLFQKTTSDSCCLCYLVKGCCPTSQTHPDHVPHQYRSDQTSQGLVSPRSIGAFLQGGRQFIRFRFNYIHSASLAVMHVISRGTHKTSNPLTVNNEYIRSSSSPHGSDPSLLMSDPINPMASLVTRCQTQL